MCEPSGWLDHVECDEIWTFVGKKQARLTVQEKAERHDIGDVYLWTAVDATTKLVPSYVIGKRSADNARKLMIDLASRLTFPSPHAGDVHAFHDPLPLYVTQLSTDGFAGYPEAVDLAFGAHARYGVIVKQYRNAGMQYDPSEIVGTDRRGVRGLNFAEERSICTSHVERHNGSIRCFMKRFSRLTYAFSKKLENLENAVAMFMAYYNFCWRTRYPDDSGKCGRLRPTAAMMAGVTDRLWSFEDLMAA